MSRLQLKGKEEVHVICAVVSIPEREKKQRRGGGGRPHPAARRCVR